MIQEKEVYSIALQKFDFSNARDDPQEVKKNFLVFFKYLKDITAEVREEHKQRMLKRFSDDPNDLL